MKNIFLFITCLLMTSLSVQAQNDTMFVMQYGNVIGFYKVSEIDSIVFYKPLTTVTDIEGNVYNTITIGPQVWMKENLKVTKYNDGTDIPWITDNTAWSTLNTPGYCWFNNDILTYKNLYGALYNWYTVNITTNGNKNICPVGWHVPTDADLTYLKDYLGGTSIAGGKLKETGISHWNDPNTGADNSSKFTALPGGYRHSNATFNSTGITGNFWSSTEHLGSYGIYWYLQNNITDFIGTFATKELGVSVRCIKD